MSLGDTSLSVPVDALMALRLATKGWNAAVDALIDALIDDGVRSGELMVYDGKDISYELALARAERREFVTLVIFNLNITKIGDDACCLVVNLVVVDIPEGIERISTGAFWECESLTTVSFPKTLKSIGNYAFEGCRSLDNVNLLHTNLQELGRAAFVRCSELKSMTISDSLQTFGADVLYKCSKLVSSSIKIDNKFKSYSDKTSAAVAYLRSQQLLSATPPAPHADNFCTTIDFRRLFVGFIHNSTLMSLWFVLKAWKAVAEEVIDEGVRAARLLFTMGRI
ncbi:hypothetical protein TL16_g07768 [Triparma laevis f. inornata]|uniref:Uncharacterized protein n=1 Tax=Triparma laevis f. inornata TaxID=1714386 RepID=A0A9W7AU43_9STRA|nr:hypothetical protein TL16_g07768 [Triparma laevis f. inornata]